MKEEAITWRAPEYTYREKSVDWFWGAGLIGAAIAIAAIVVGNVLFGIFAAIATFTLLMYAARKPRMVEVLIDHRGVKINRVFYPYNILTSFWIHNHGNAAKKLIIESERGVFPHVAVPIADDVDTEKLRDYLLVFLPEEEHPESLSEIVLEYLGF